MEMSNKQGKKKTTGKALEKAKKEKTANADTVDMASTCAWVPTRTNTMNDQRKIV